MSQTRPIRQLPPVNWLILFTAVLWLVMILPPVVLLSWLSGQSASAWVLASLVLSPLMFVWSWHVINRASSHARWLTMQYMGFSAVLLPLLLPAWVATFFVDFYLVGLSTLVAWIIIAAFGIRAATCVTEKYLAFTSEKLDRSYRIVQISDVHVGSRSTRFLESVVDQLMTHTPNAVVITGDLLDLDDIGIEQLAPLRKLTCPVYLCLGNHESYVDLDKAIDAIELCGIQVLRNRSVRLGALQLHGVDDQHSSNRVGPILNTLALQSRCYQILLYHRPDGWAAALEYGIDLTLAGHTHAGQIWPFRYIVARQFKQLVGHFEHLGQHLYVSPGTGTWGPIMRLGTRCEMTVIDLSPK